MKTTTTEIIFNYVAKANTLIKQANECIRDRQIEEANKRLTTAIQIKNILIRNLNKNSGSSYEAIRDAIGSLNF